MIEYPLAVEGQALTIRTAPGAVGMAGEWERACRQVESEMWGAFGLTSGCLLAGNLESASTLSAVDRQLYQTGVSCLEKQPESLIATEIFSNGTAQTFSLLEKGKGHEGMCWLQGVIFHHCSRTELLTIEEDLRRSEAGWKGRQLVIMPWKEYRQALGLFSLHVAKLAEARHKLRQLQGTIHPSIRRAVKSIEENLQHELHLQDIADDIGINKDYLSRLFSQEMGCTFVDYVNRTRIQLACQKLRNPTLRISEIAFATGFQSLSQFNRAFLRVMGCNPSDYREQPVAAGSMPVRSGS